MKPPQHTVEIHVPGSKSITNRALPLAAVAKGKTLLENALDSEDTRHMIAALKSLGVKVKQNKNTKIEVHGTAGSPSKKTLFCGNSGTTLRFLTAILATKDFESILDGDLHMRKRPVKDLLDALVELGANASSLKRDGFPPIKVSGPLLGGHCNIEGRISSQFISAILMAAPLAKNDVTIHIVGALTSKPYVELTINLMRKFGVLVKWKDKKTLFIKSGQIYKAREVKIESDASAATYFWGISALTKEKIQVNDLPKNSAQADLALLAAIEKIKKGSCSINCAGFPDGAMTLAVLCAFFDGDFTLTGLSNLRFKECDRLYALATELKRIGCQTRETPDGLIIHGDPAGLHKAAIHTYNDHRIAMCFGMASAVIPGLKIMNPKCVSKTYPNFWKDLEIVKKGMAQKNIIITGMRGTGKTRLGSALGRALGRRFIDIDEFIEKSEHKLIPEIISKHGWKHFRELEKAAVKKIAHMKNLIISTGGGTMMDRDNARLLKTNGKVILLACPAGVLKKRLEFSHIRPPLKKNGNALSELKAVASEREKRYKEVADTIIDVSRQTNNKKRDLEQKLEKLIKAAERFGIHS